MNASVPPRDAASLILLRNRTHVLMGRRRDTARFMPGMMVFPGGAMEPQDRLFTLPSTDRDAEVLRAMAVNGSQSRAAALRITAVRETMEETGFSPSQIANGIDPETQISKVASQLVYVGRAITPPQSRIRFNARFFLASEEWFEGELLHGGELEVLRWVPLTELDTLPMPMVTRFMANRAIIRSFGESGYRFPLFTYYGGKRRVRYVT